MNCNILNDALEQYNMQNQSAVLTGHNENMTFNIADLFLLRIHKSANSFDSDFLYDKTTHKEKLEDELEFLNFLHKQHFHVQVPVNNKCGDNITVLNDGTLATSLSWIKGISLKKADINCELSFNIGCMIANLHNASSGYQHINTIKYDGLLCEKLKEIFAKAVQNNMIKTFYGDIIIAACDSIKKLLTYNEKVFLTVHGDFSFDNIIVSENGLVPIDFSLSGWGHPMMDLSCMAGFLDNKEHINALFDGYKSAGRTIDMELYNACKALNELMGIVMHLSRLSSEIWFDRWLEELCSSTFIPVIEKE